MKLHWATYLGEPFCAFVSRLKARGMGKETIKKKVFEAVMVSPHAISVPKEVLIERIEIGVRARLGEMRTAEKAHGNLPSNCL